MCFVWGRPGTVDDDDDEARSTAGVVCDQVRMAVLVLVVVCLVDGLWHPSSELPPFDPKPQGPSPK